MEDMINYAPLVSFERLDIIPVSDELKPLRIWTNSFSVERRAMRRFCLPEQLFLGAAVCPTNPFIPVSAHIIREPNYPKWTRQWRPLQRDPWECIAST